MSTRMEVNTTMHHVPDRQIVRLSSQIAIEALLANTDAADPVNTLELQADRHILKLHRSRWTADRVVGDCSSLLDNVAWYNN